MMHLDPLSIATGGYIGQGPPVTLFCPTALAIGSDGYIRLDPNADRFTGDGGSGAPGPSVYIPETGLPPENDKFERSKLAALAIIAIEAIEDD